VKRFVDALGQIFQIFDQTVPFCAGPCDAHYVRFLERIRADRRRRDLPGKHHHWSAVHQRVLQRSDDIGGPGATGHDDHARFPGYSGVPFGHVPTPLFVPWQDKIEIFRFVNGVEHGQYGPTGVPKHLVHFVGLEQIVQDFRPGHAHEPFVVVGQGSGVEVGFILVHDLLRGVGQGRRGWRRGGRCLAEQCRRVERSGGGREHGPGWEMVEQRGGAHGQERIHNDEMTRNFTTIGFEDPILASLPPTLYIKHNKNP